MKELPNFSPSDITESNEETVHEDKPQQSVFDQYDCFKKRGLHFFHLKACRLLPKIYEVHLVTKSTNEAVVAVRRCGSTTPCLTTSTFPATACDRNREGGGVSSSGVTLLTTGVMILVLVNLCF